MHTVALQNSIYRLYLLILIFAPLAFGCADYWALAIVEIGAAAGLLFWAVYRRRSGEPLVRVPGLVPLLLIVGWFFLQLVPLPAGLVAMISPSTHNAYQESAGVLQPVGWMPLTLHPEATLAELLRLSGYVLFYVLSVHLLLERKRLQTTVNVVIGYTAALAFLAVFQRFNSNNRVLWIREIYEGGFYGPYINGNHMAGLLVMVLPLALVMFLYNRPPVRYQSMRDTAVEFLTHPSLHVHMLLGLCSLTCMVAIFLSLARGAIVSACLSIGLMGLGVMKITRNWRRGTSIVVGAAVVIISVGWFGWGPIISTFDQLVDQHGRINMVRPVVWQDSLGIVADFPVFGSGAGTYESIYPGYRSFTENVLFRHAHNDYIEFLVTGGVPLMILMGWFVAAVMVRTYRIYRRRREPYCLFLYIGTFAGIVGIGLHSVVEFNFQNGANGLYFFFLVSLLVAAAHTRLRATDRPSLLKKLPIKSYGALFFMAVLVIFCASGYAVGVGIADALYADTPDIMAKEAITLKEFAQVEDLMRPTAILAPFNYMYPFLRADAATKAALERQATDHYVASLRRNPLSALTMQELGRLLERAEQSDKAEHLFKTGIRRVVQSPDGYNAYAEWLFEKGRIDEGLGQMRMAIQRDLKNTLDYIDSMEIWGLTNEEMAKAIPEMSVPCLAMASYLREMAEDQLAEKYYRKALQAEFHNETASAGLFQQIYQHYYQQELWQKALTVAQQGVERLPKDPGLRISSARMYEKLGITYRASEEYRKALILRPGFRAARDGLRRLDGDD
jgi:O-antigen ligase/Tfp pilus assembly protein PilF